jgi:hypothetical protein
VQREEDSATSDTAVVGFVNVRTLSICKDPRKESYNWFSEMQIVGPFWSIQANLGNSKRGDHDA